jgi:hypothetical protein
VSILCTKATLHTLTRTAVTVETWTLDEIRKAVERGSGLVDVFEFWEYSVTRFVKGDVSGSLCRVRQRVPKIKTLVIRLPILGA